MVADALHCEIVGSDIGSSNQFTTPWQDEQVLEVELTEFGGLHNNSGDRNWSGDPLVSSCQAVAIITLIYNILHLHLLESILTLTFISYLPHQSNSLYLAS